MGASGYINWHKLEHTAGWIRQSLGRQTFVFAFWMIDYTHPQRDLGLRVLKNEGGHPDWFVHADAADHVLAAYTSPNSVLSPNFNTVFDNNLAAKPLLGSLLVGTSDAIYKRHDDSHWWASSADLTWRGRRTVKKLNALYERPATLVTFIDRASDENHAPRSSS